MMTSYQLKYHFIILRIWVIKILPKTLFVSLLNSNIKIKKFEKAFLKFNYVLSEILKLKIRHFYFSPKSRRISTLNMKAVKFFTKC